MNRTALLVATVVVSSVPGQTTRAKRESTAAERTFVAELDAAWSSGSPLRVSKLFRFVHPQVKRAVQRRVIETTGGKSAARRSVITRIFETRSEDGGRRRALCLNVTIASSAPAATPRRQFEILVLHEATDGTGALLVQTTRDAQRRVALPGSKDVGLPIGQGLRAPCPACNYTVGSPKMGNWVLVARPTQMSGCFEGIEVYSLDHDLAMELAILPDCAQGKRDVDDLVRKMRRGWAYLHGAQLSAAEVRELEKGPLRGSGTRFSLFESEPNARTFDIRAYRFGDVVYVMSFQYGPNAKAVAKRAVEEMHDTFGVLDASRPPNLRQLIEDHALPGQFTNDDSVFEVAELALRIDAPDAKWRTARTLSNARFHGSWTCSETGSSLTVLGVHCCDRAWSMPMARQWLDDWSKSQPKRYSWIGELERKKFGDRSGWWGSHELASRSGKTRGFTLVIPMGNDLVVVIGHASAGERQTAVLEKLERAGLGLRIGK